MILLAAKQVHVDEPLAASLDVPVQHGRVRVEPEFVGGAVDVQPLVTADLASPRGVVGTIVEDLCSASRKGTEPGLLEIGNHGPGAGESVLASLGDSLEVNDLDRGERLQVEGGSRLADRREHRRVVVELEPGVQAADEVDLGRARVCGSHRGVPDLVHRHFIGTLLSSLPVKRAEGAAQGTDIRVVDVPIDVVEGRPAMHSAADEVGKPADRVEVPGPIQKIPVFEREPGARHHPLGDGMELRILDPDGDGLFGEFRHDGHPRWTSIDTCGWIPDLVPGPRGRSYRPDSDAVIRGSRRSAPVGILGSRSREHRAPPAIRGNRVDPLLSEGGLERSLA